MTTYPAFPELSRAFSLEQSESPVDPTLRDTMENGIETTRARWTRNRRTFSMALKLLSPADKDALDTFYTNATTGSGFGALPFLVADPRNLENPQTYLVRFASLPKYVDAGWIGADALTGEGFRWNCTFQVREV